jgi:hypothetical protein
MHDAVVIEPRHLLLKGGGAIRLQTCPTWVFSQRPLKQTTAPSGQPLPVDYLLAALPVDFR